MNVVDVRAGNIRLLLSSLRFSEGMTKRDLSQATGLSFSTVGTLCNLLINRGIIEEVDLSTSRIGRTPKIVRIRQNRCLTICLDFQRETSFGIGILGINNSILLSQRYQTNSAHTMEELVQLAHQKFKDLCLQYSWMQQAGYIGVGVAVSGVFDKESRRIVTSASPIMENALVTDTVEQTFSLPCYTDNEANLCAIAMCESESRSENLVYLHLSQGTGVGIICEGNLLRGNRGYAAEVSHIPLGSPVKRCPSCGNYGCIETALCVQGMVEDFDINNISSDYMQRWQQISEEIHTDNANEHTARYLSEKGTLIGILLSILVNLFDPQKIFIGGEICSIFPLLQPTILAVLQKRCAVFQQTTIPLLCDNNSEKSILLGLNHMLYERWDPFSS